MKVKELKKKLKGQYTDIRPVHTDHRKATPFTQLGKDLDGLAGKAFDRVLDEKEVVEWKLGEWKKTSCWTGGEMATGAGHCETQRWLTIYFK